MLEVGKWVLHVTVDLGKGPHRASLYPTYVFQTPLPLYSNYNQLLSRQEKKVTMTLCHYSKLADSELDKP